MSKTNKTVLLVVGCCLICFYLIGWLAYLIVGNIQWSYIVVR
jgi:hypothetical protein